ncbi:MAG: LysR family transcriptional regulator [Deltaproteobacteria bacterium]
MEQKVSAVATLPDDLVDLRAFCLVADLGSITAAARALDETKGAVSRRVTRLERVLGVTLLRRSPRLVSVTEDGAAFRVRVGRALDMLDDAAGALQAARSTPQGLLRITAPTDMGVLIAPLVAEFIGAYPAVRVDAIITQNELDFDAHQLDIAFRAAATLRDSSLIAHKLIDLTLGFYAAPGYLASHGAPRRPDDLENHRLYLMRFRGGVPEVSLRSDGEPQLVEKLALRGVIVANDGVFVREATLAGGGIALLPSVMVERDVTDGRLAPVLRHHSVVEQGALYLLHSASPFMPPKVRAFRDFVKGKLATECATRRKRAKGRPVEK